LTTATALPREKKLRCEFVKKYLLFQKAYQVVNSQVNQSTRCKKKSQVKHAKVKHGGSFISMITKIKEMVLIQKPGTFINKI